jgi:hypothetical protein
LFFLLPLVLIFIIIIKIIIKTRHEQRKLKNKKCSLCKQRGSKGRKRARDKQNNKTEARAKVKKKGVIILIGESVAFYPDQHDKKD